MDYDEDAHSSLSDSTYEIISESSFRNSDGEEELDSHNDTDSLLSFGEPSPLTSEAADGTDNATHQDADPVEHQMQLHIPGSHDTSLVVDHGPVSSPKAGFEPRQVHAGEPDRVEQHLSTPSLDVSSLPTIHPDSPSMNYIQLDTRTSESSYNSLAQAAEWINFQEPVRVADGLLNISDKSLHHQETSEEGHLSNDLLPVLESVRLLYSGPLDQTGEIKYAIVEKVAHALSLSSAQDDATTTTLNAVRVSDFGDDEADGGIVVLSSSSSLQLKVVDCSKTGIRNVKPIPGPLNLAIHVIPAGQSSEELKNSLLEVALSPFSTIVLSEEILSDPTSLSHIRRFAMQHGHGFVFNTASAVSTALDGEFESLPASVMQFLNMSPRHINRQLASVVSIPQKSPLLTAFEIVRSVSAQLFTLYWTTSCFLIICLVSLFVDHVVQPASKRLDPTIEKLRPLYRLARSKIRGHELHLLVGLTSLMIASFTMDRLIFRPLPATQLAESQNLQQIAPFAPSAEALHDPTSTPSALLASTSEASLSVVNTQNALSIIPSVSNSISTTISNFLTGKAEIDMLEMEGDEFVLVAGGSLELPVLIKVSTDKMETESETFKVSRKGRSFISTGPDVRMLNASALAICLPINTYCGRLNISIIRGDQSTPAGQFVFDRKCVDLVPTTDWQIVFEQAKNVLDGAVDQVLSLSTTWTTGMIPYVPEVDWRALGNHHNIRQTAKVVSDLGKRVGDSSNALMKISSNTAMTIYESAATMADGMYWKLKKERSWIRSRIQSAKQVSREKMMKYVVAREQRNIERYTKKMRKLEKIMSNLSARKASTALRKLDRLNSKLQAVLAARQARITNDGSSPMGGRRTRNLHNVAFKRLQRRAVKVADKVNEGWKEAGEHAMQMQRRLLSGLVDPAHLGIDQWFASTVKGLLGVQDSRPEDVDRGADKTVEDREEEKRA